MLCPFPVGLWHGPCERDGPIGRVHKAVVIVPLSRSDRDRPGVAICYPVCQNPSRSLHALVMFRAPVLPDLLRSVLHHVAICETEDEPYTQEDGNDLE
ncbi:hypothetical protein Taro_035306 [Colocasia esculenta]|uniref:Uncharacterized protein n=1 Tax=Colocasia esculenta TaxID=4460 RepID=A0A843WI96_COLES|nr:hypothetical protein [Colocasia esculenta]